MAFAPTPAPLPVGSLPQLAASLTGAWSNGPGRVESITGQWRFSHRSGLGKGGLFLPPRQLAWLSTGKGACRRGRGPARWSTADSPYIIDSTWQKCLCYFFLSSLPVFCLYWVLVYLVVQMKAQTESKSNLFLGLNSREKRKMKMEWHYDSLIATFGPTCSLFNFLLIWKLYLLGLCSVWFWFSCGHHISFMMAPGFYCYFQSFTTFQALVNRGHSLNIHSPPPPLNFAAQQ